MRRSVLLAYQVVTGLSDAGTGLLLIAAPQVTLALMRLHVQAEVLPFVSYLGAFVLSVGIACFYGAWQATRMTAAEPAAAVRVEVVWLLTGITRALVAAFLIVKVASGTLGAGWATVALTDGLFALIQFTGLSRGWLRDVRP